MAPREDGVVSPTTPPPSFILYGIDIPRSKECSKERLLYTIFKEHNEIKQVGPTGHIPDTTFATCVPP
eukprot:scaffold454_cov124-Isochrysis_galbana.AAC.24